MTFSCKTVKSLSNNDNARLQLIIRRYFLLRLELGKSAFIYALRVAVLCSLDTT